MKNMRIILLASCILIFGCSENIQYNKNDIERGRKYLTTHCESVEVGKGVYRYECSKKQRI
jgi:hypothetical protein